MAVIRREAHTYWDAAGLVKLICGLLLGPLAWFIDLEISYATVKWACAHDRRDLILLIPLGTLALIAVATWCCWSSWAVLRNETTLDGGSVKDRSGFLAVVGLMMNATFALLVITTFAARYVLSPCE